ncbi:hypothetical protein PG2006B_1593 [Bifidobacterium animalis subsp. animalis]|nr:hypothetical protein PG2006B_1593 [Bifidobacterium animalis subsp. animalis]
MVRPQPKLGSFIGMPLRSSKPGIGTLIPPLTLAGFHTRTVSRCHLKVVALLLNFIVAPLRTLTLVL